MKAELESLSNELVSAVFTGGAQGILLIAAVWLVLKLCRRANAATRHAAWFATLLVVAALPTAVFVWPRANALISATRELVSPALRTETETLIVTTAPASQPQTAEEAFADDPPIEFESVVADAPQTAAVATEPHEPLTQTGRTDLEFAIPRYLGAVALGCWFVFALLRLAALARQLHVLHWLKTTAAEPPGNLAALFHQIQSAAGATRTARLRVCEDIRAPMVAGFWKPAAMIPARLCDAPEEKLAPVFRHELAHVARYDDWANLVQQAIGAIFFFHPGIHFVSRRISVEREIACDDHALAGSRSRREYALLLTEFASRMSGRDFTAAPAAWSSNSQLKERVGMILDGKRNTSLRASRWGIGALTAVTLSLAAAGFALAPRLVLAAEQPDAKEPEVEVIAATTEDVVSEAAPEVSIAFESDVNVETDLVLAETGPRVKLELPRVAAAADLPVPAQPALPAQPRQVAQAHPVPPAAPAHPPIGPGYGHPVPEPRPYPGPAPRAGARVNRAERGDIEARLERLERMVESLLVRERGTPHPQGEPPAGLYAPRMEEQIERAHREADRARRDAERAMREMELNAQRHAEMARRGGDQARSHEKMAMRKALEAQREALEAQRRELDRHLKALEKEMEKEGKPEDKKPAREGKPDGKPEKEEKKRDRGADDAPPEKSEDADRR